MKQRFAVLFLTSACLLWATLPVSSQSQTSLVKQISVQGRNVKYVDQGSGVAVLFVHGGISDHRTWEGQRDAVARTYRFIAIDQRYHGTDAWPDDGSNYSQTIHAADLVSFIRELKPGPVFLVGSSYGAVIAIRTALQHPDLFRGLFVLEPPIESIVTAVPDQKTMSEERKSLAALSEKLKRGDTEAITLFINWANNRPTEFETIPTALKQMFQENGLTLPLILKSPPVEEITCEQLRGLKMPVTIARGELTRPCFRLIVEALHRCIPQSELIAIPNSSHSAFRQNPAACNEALLRFLAQHAQR